MTHKQPPLVASALQPSCHLPVFLTHPPLLLFLTSHHQAVINTHPIGLLRPVKRVCRAPIPAVVGGYKPDRVDLLSECGHRLLYPVQRFLLPLHVAIRSHENEQSVVFVCITAEQIQVMAYAFPPAPPSPPSPPTSLLLSPPFKFPSLPLPRPPVSLPVPLPFPHRSRGEGEGS